MSQDGVEIAWIVLSAVASALAVLALREAWRDRRALVVRKTNGRRGAISANMLAVQLIRAGYSFISLLAAVYSFSLPNPPVYHVPQPFEVAMMAVVLLGLAEIITATAGDLRVWHYLNAEDEHEH